jgi:broad specificity phosphatase PhoE
MTPTPPPTPGQQAMQLASGWDQHISGLDPQGQLPDQAREALAEQYYQQNLLPFYVKNGYNPVTGHDAFMQYAQRPGKESHPVLATIGKEAVSSFAQPILGLLGNTKLWGKNPPDPERMHGMQKDLESWVSKSTQDALQQGSSPTTIGGAQFLGQAVGMLPYAPVFGEAAGMSETAGLPRILQHGFAGGVFGGLYESARTSNFVEGMKGALTGAEFAGALGTLGALKPGGPLWKSLAAKGVGEEVAKSIEAVAKGQGSTMDYQRAAEELAGNPKVTEHVQGWLAEQVQAAHKNGIPQDSTAEGTRDKLRVTMLGADGKKYNLGGIQGMPVGELQPLVERIVEHLQAGGRIDKVAGGGSAVTSFLSLIEKANAQKGMYDLEVPRGGASPVEGEGEVVPNDEARGQQEEPAGDVPIGEGGVRGARVEPPIKFDIATHEAIPEEGAEGSPEWLDHARRIYAQEKLGKSYDELSSTVQQVVDAQIKSGEAGRFARERKLKLDQPIESVPPTMDLDKPQSLSWTNTSKTGLAWMPAEYNERGVEHSRWFEEQLDLPSSGPAFDRIPRGSVSLNPDKKQAISYILAKDPEIAATSIRNSIEEKYPQTKDWNWITDTDFYSGRFARARKPQVPPLDMPEPPQEEQPAATQLPGRIRGSADIPLSQAGLQQVSEEAAGFAQRAGSRPVTIGADSTQRTQQTAQAYLSKMPEAQVLPPNPAWDSRARGSFEGGDVDVAKKYNQAMLEAGKFNVPDPGVSSYSGKPGESWQQHFQRIIPATTDLMQRFWQDPEAVNIQVTHFTPIQLVKAWLKGEGMVDPQELLRPEMDTGAVWRLAPKEGAREGSTAAADWQLTRVDPTAKGKLQGGVYLVRHGETSWNSSGEMPRAETGEIGEVQFEPGESKQTPLVNRLRGVDLGEGNKGFEIGTGEGNKPTLMYQDRVPDRETLFHENLHGHFSYLGMHDFLADNFEDGFVHDVFNGAVDNHGDIYPERGRAEEVYNYVASAVRTGNEEALQQYADADTDLDTTLQWVTDRSKQLLDEAATKADSLHKRVLERRVNAVNNRATNMLSDIQQSYSHADQQIDYAGGRFSAQAPDGATHYFSSREQLLQHLERTREPLNTPELVPTDSLPNGFPRYSRGVSAPSNGTAPIGTDPPPPELTTGEKPPLGLNYLSNFVRPFYDWISTVGVRLGMPELPAAFQRIHENFNTMAHVQMPYMQELMDGIGKKTRGFLGGNYTYDHERQSDFLNYVAAQSEEDQQAAMKEFRITPDEQRMLESFKETFKPTGLFDYLHDILPRVKALQPGSIDELKAILADASPNVRELISRGTLSLSDTDLLRVTATYLRGHMWHTYMEDSVKDAEDLVKARKDDVNILQPLLKRQLEYYRGVPDFTQRVVKSAMETAVSAINQGLEKVESLLPDGVKLPRITTPPEDVLGKYITFSYAGMMGLKPATVVRAGLQLFTTAYPVLGEKYLWQGMDQAFKPGAYKIGQKFGWTISQDQLGELIAGGGDFGEESGGDSGLLGKAGEKLEGTARAMLQPIRWSHNAARLVTGWGFKAKISDALEAFAQDGDKQQFIKDSGLWFARDAQRTMLMREAASVVGGGSEAMEQFALRAARTLVEATHWDYSKGAQPGIYKYQIGRVFGQYGTWPLNYIEYARRFLTSGSGTEARNAFIRLALAHGAIGAAGTAVGIDAGKWLWTQPMAYGGGPILNALVNVPGSMDFETARGDESRRQVVAPFFPSLIPGGEEAEGIHRAIAEGEKDQWLKILGFVPLEQRNR